MNPYSYPATQPQFNLKFKESNDICIHYYVDFPIAKPTCHSEHNIALGEYLQPQGQGVFPLAILVHGWGDRSLAPCRMLAKDLIKAGFACFILRTLFHTDRMAKGIQKKLPHLTADEWFEGYQTSVIDIRQILDWTVQNKQIDSNRIAVIGVSLGGIISTISMGIDGRIKAGVILVAGGNYENQKWLKRTEPKLTEEEYIKREQRYRNYLAEVEQRGFENVEPPRRSYLTDPVTFGCQLRDRSLLMINATLDERIPKRSTVDLWEACGKPEIKWLPGTHSSIWLFYPYIRKHVINFLRTILEV
jgi:esterase/lipase